ncbi:hypothetical protein [Rhodococcus sp. HNM0563]|uniref:hypothetical protein n=1 Tax=Rhodococcus sp. HNM0563 TaxID=2716339 RepID=UPI001F0E1B20|nr:hypothetical protein [Rhodococcus sp. HNM0563]
MRAFLDACAVPAEHVDAQASGFRLWAGGPEDRSERWRQIATELLGGPRRTQHTHCEWRVRAERVNAILDALDGAAREDVTRYGRPLVGLVVGGPARLIDPATGEAYAGVSVEDSGRFEVDGYGRTLGVSGVRATIGSTGSSLSLWLSFPGDHRLPAAAAHVQEHAPVRFSVKHWRRWTPSRTGDGYRSIRIPSPLAR